MNKKTSTLIVLLLLAAAQWCPAQLSKPNDLIFTTPDTTDGAFVARRMIAAADGSFITVGDWGDDGYISKTGSCGSLLWIKTYRFGAATGFNSVAELPSGEIVAAGACTDCAPQDSTEKALVVKTDAAGALLADTTLGRFRYNAQATDVIATAQGNIAVCGQAIFAAFLSPNNAFLAVLNTGLQGQVWKEYDHFYYDNARALLQTADGGFVVAGYSSPALFDPPQAQLFRTNPAGELLWKYTAAHLNSQFNDAVQAPDGSILGYGDRWVDSLRGRDVYLAVVNESTGALTDQKNFGSTADDAGKSLERTPEGYLAGATYGAPSQAGWSIRNWVFRLDEQLALQEQHFRDGFLFGHFLINAVPLSCSARAFAYHSRLVFFGAYQLQFFKRTFPGERLALDRMPQHYQLVPRDRNTNLGAVEIAGALDDIDAYSSLQLDVFRNGAAFQTLTQAAAPVFSFQTEIPAELAEFTFRLKGIQGQTACLEAEACDVVAGDAYLIQGQSNAVAGLPYDPDNTIDHAYRHHRTPFVRNFGLKASSATDMVWHRESGPPLDYSDNISGQWGLLLGKKIAEMHGVPVAILNGAVSGISIDSLSPPNPRYGAFVARVQQSGLREHLRGIFWFQGETNAGAAFYDSADKYFQKFQLLDNAWRQDFPALENRYLFQIRPGAYWIGATLLTCLQIEEAQRRVAEQLPGWQIMSTTGMNHDSTHYYYPNGYERAANDIFRLVEQDLYGAPAAANSHPPTVDTVYFSHCNRREITLQLRHAADTYTWTNGWESDFRLEGSTATTVVSGQVQGRLVLLQLSAAPGPGFTGLSYTAHPGGSEAPVKNANGIGMLTFYRKPVAPYNLSAQVTTVPVACNGQATGSATAAAAGGTAPYGYLWPNNASIPNPGNLPAGVYTVTVTDARGCSITASAVVSQPPALAVGAMSMPATCNGGSDGSATAQASGGTAGYSFTWSNGAATAQAGNLSAGTYTVLVTDANGCTASSVVAVGAPAAITTMVQSTSCSPADTGTIIVVLSSYLGCDSTVVATTSLLPSDSVALTLYTCDPNGAGTFTQFLSNQFGCDSVIVTTVIFDAIELAGIAVEPDSGMASGQITVTPDGGQPPYSFTWSNGDHSATADSLGAGTYTVTITDAGGCTAAFEIPVLVNSGAPEQALSVRLFPNPCRDALFLNAPEIAGISNCHIRVMDVAGNPVLGPFFPDGARTRLDVAQLPPGTYFLQIMTAGTARWSGRFLKM
ncbi:MAG: T9SS type A sorting domain-containing protein [Saprospiraceae bacterium]|nr:T9SS type A sorting domain-containing protein [Saprospiraceae bacterium]